MTIQSNSAATAHIDAFNSNFEGMDALKRLELICSNYATGIVLSTSLGLEDQVLADMIARAQLPITLFTLDTGRLFQETYDVLELTRQRYKLPIQVYFPETDRVQHFVNENGPNSFYLSIENRKACCFIRKVEPLQRALKGASVWITGLRASQNKHRSQMHFAEWDATHNVLKVNPLMDWTDAQVQEYITSHHVPVNTLHARGYPSIGCAPCTRAVEPGEDPRAGRWWWEIDKKECGLHTTN